MPLLHVVEQRLSSAQDNRMHDQPELIDQALVHQTGDQSGAANCMHVLARLLLHVSDFLDVSNDPRGLPGDLV